MYYIYIYILKFGRKQNNRGHRFHYMCLYTLYKSDGNTHSTNCRENYVQDREVDP